MASTWALTCKGFLPAVHESILRPLPAMLFTVDDALRWIRFRGLCMPQSPLCRIASSASGSRRRQSKIPSRQGHCSSIDQLLSCRNCTTYIDLVCPLMCNHIRIMIDIWLCARCTIFVSVNSWRLVVTRPKGLPGTERIDLENVSQTVEAQSV